MTEPNSRPLDYRGPLSGPPQPQSPKDRRRQMWAGLGCGLAVSGAAAALAFLAGLASLAIFLLGAKLLAMIVLLTIRERRMFGLGMLLSSLAVLLIFLGTCAVIVAGLSHGPH